MNRALPGRITRIIDDGANPADLARAPHKAIRWALVTTAMSAHARGWDRTEWEALLDHPGSRLGQQTRMREHGRVRSEIARQKMMDSAWDRAVAEYNSSPPTWTPDQAATAARERVKAYREIIADPDIALTDVERAVLGHFVDLAETRGITRIAGARRTVASDLQLPERATREALVTLVDCGVLELAERGRSGKSEKKRTANLFALLDPERLQRWAETPRAPITHPQSGSVGRDRIRPVGRPSKASLGRAVEEKSSACGTPSSEPTTRQVADELKRMRSVMRDDLDASPESVTFTASPTAIKQLRRLALEAGINIDAFTEEKP